MRSSTMVRIPIRWWWRGQHVAGRSRTTHVARSYRCELSTPACAATTARHVGQLGFCAPGLVVLKTGGVLFVQHAVFVVHRAVAEFVRSIDISAQSVAKVPVEQYRGRGGGG